MCGDKIYFSYSRDWWAGLGSRAIYLKDEDVGCLDLAACDTPITKFFEGRKAGLWTLDALDGCQDQIWLSVSRDQSTSHGPFLRDEDFFRVRRDDGRIEEIIDGRDLHLRSLDALSLVVVEDDDPAL